MTSAQLAQRLLEERSKLPNLRNFALVGITFRWKGKDITCQGIEYDSVRQYVEGELSVVRDGKKVGDDYTERRIELVGKMPDFMKERKRFHGTYEQKNVIRMPNDDGDWYVVGYYDDDEINKYHPVGKSFSLGRWPHELFKGERIDHHDEKKRERVRVVQLRSE